jgi:hypothetical protein
MHAIFFVLYGLPHPASVLSIRAASSGVCPVSMGSIAPWVPSPHFNPNLMGSIAPFQSKFNAHGFHCPKQSKQPFHSANNTVRLPFIPQCMVHTSVLSPSIVCTNAQLHSSMFQEWVGGFLAVDSIVSLMQSCSHRLE